MKRPLFVERQSRVDHTVINYRKRFCKEPREVVWNQEGTLRIQEPLIPVKNLNKEIFHVSVRNTYTVEFIKKYSKQCCYLFAKN